MKHARGKPAPAQRVAFFHEVLNVHHLGSLNAEPIRLHLKVAIKIQIIFVDQDRRTGCRVKPRKPSHVVDMRMRADNCAHLQIMPPQDFQNAFHFVARVHHDRFARRGIAQYRTVTMQHPHWNYFVNQFFRHRT